MELVKITDNNLLKEHICCAISDKGDIGIIGKKEWLRERIKEGLVFLKCDVRGKCFIEYIPVENAWVPIDAPEYMYIDCMWVSGQFKGHGYSNILMDACIKDAKEKGKKGICMLSSKKKTGFLINRDYLEYKGFKTVDKFDPYFELMALNFSEGEVSPKFIKSTNEDNYTGYKIYYTNQCPFAVKYVPILEEVAKKNGVMLQAVHILTKEQAQSAPCPFTTFSLFYNGSFITHEVQSEAKFEKIIFENKQKN